MRLFFVFFEKFAKVRIYFTKYIVDSGKFKVPTPNFAEN